MKNIFNYKIQRLAFLVVLTGLLALSACDDEESPSTKVVLLSFGPSGVHHGDEIVFIGQNLDKVTSIVLQPSVEVSRDAFTSVTSGEIKLNVPDAAEAGKVILKTPDGDIESKTILNFEVPVVISSITGEARPGTNITITGDKINWIESVTFPSDLVVEKDDFVSQSLTELVVTVPMEAQTGYILFATGGTKPLSFGSKEQLVVSLPEVTSLNPTSIRHTGELTLTGTDLDLVTSIVFEGGTEVSEFVSQSETEIKVVVPATALKGKLTLKQASPVDVVTDSELTIILPAVTSVSPSPVIPGQDNLTITGTDLDLIKELILPGIGIITEFISQSATEIVLAVPEGTTQGPISYTTIHGYESPLEGALIKLPPTSDFPTLDYYIYNDGLQNGWQAYGGWGHVSQDYSNAENPANGELAIKSVFNDPYGAVQIHNSGATNVFDGYNYLVFYVYVAGEESDVIVQIGENADYYPAHFTGDKYFQIVVPLADLASADNVSELRIKNKNLDAATNNTTVFIDEIGLTVGEPEAPYESPDTYIYKDGLATGWEAWDGWGHSSKDWVSEDKPFRGSTSIKVTYNDNYGALQIHPVSSDALSGYSELVLYVWFDADGRYAIQFNDAGEKAFDVIGGQFNRLVVPLSEFATEVSNLNELRFKNYGTTQNHTVYIDEVGLNL